MTGDQLLFMLAGFILGFLACAIVEFCDNASHYFKKKNKKDVDNEKNDC